MRKLNPFLLDLQGLVYNAYHAGMSPEPIKGELFDTINTAEYGFESFLTKFFDPILEIAGSPIHMIAVTDGGNTYRKSLYSGYKADREAKKKAADPVQVEQMKKAMEYAKQFLASLGIPLVNLKGQEADDVIAYLRGKLGGHKTIVTIDKDLVALAGPDCGVFRNGLLEMEYNDKGTVVPANLVSLYLSIVGDSADSFPGLKGCGPKAWEKMVEDFGHDGMEQLRDLADRNARLEIKAIAQVAGNKTLTKLAEEYDNWYVQYQLAKLHPEICEGARVNLDWYKRVPTIERLTKVMTSAGLRDLIHKYDKYTYKSTLVTQENLSQCLAEIEALTPETLAVAWDYETFDPVKNENYLKAVPAGKTYADVINSKIAGCSFALGANLNHVYYISCRHANTNNVSDQWVLNLIKHFEDEGIEMVAQNVSFEATVTYMQLNHEVKHWVDTKAFAHHVDENNPNGLKDLSKRYLNYAQIDYKTTLANAGAADMSEISGEAVLSYGADDSLVTGHLYQFFTLLTQIEGTYDFIQEYECPAVAELIWPYINGVKLDPEEMAKQRAVDEQTVIDKMVVIRSLLNQHCTDPNFEAVEALFEDQKSYYTAKAEGKFEGSNPSKEELNGAIKQALIDARQKLKDNCRYIEPYEVRHAAEFVPSASKMTLVATTLGLPPFEKDSKQYMSDYLSDTVYDKEDPKQVEFMRLLPGFVNQKAKRAGEHYEAMKTFCEQVLWDIAKVTVEGTVLNMGSPPQMQALFYLLLGLPIRVRTKVQKDSLRHKKGLMGSPSTDASAIDFALANDCSEENAWKADVLKALKAYAAASTRISIYWNPYPLWMGPDDIMHPNFISPGTVTRRPTGSSPNLLQVSKGPVRRNFIPREEGNVIASIDFASQELRVMAAITGDENFLSAYTGPVDKDLHAMTACGIVPSVYQRYDNVTTAMLEFDGAVADYSWFKLHQDDDSYLGKMLKDIRGISKTVNFGVGYGATAQTVSQQAMIPLDISEAAVDGFHLAYPGVNVWKTNVYAFARANGYVATTYGSRRHCGNNLNSGSRGEIGRWERQLSNYLIQGQCADLLKVVLANAYRTRLFRKHGAMLIAPIYDEILVEVPRSNLHGFLHDLADLMEIKMPGICVPMVADCSFGANWGKQEEVGARPTLEKINEALAKVDAYLLSKKEAAQPGELTNEDASYDDDVLALVDESIGSDE